MHRNVPQTYALVRKRAIPQLCSSQHGCPTAPRNVCREILVATSGSSRGWSNRWRTGQVYSEGVKWGVFEEELMRRSIRKINIPPRANPGHLNVFFARGVGNLIWKAIPGVGNLTLPGWGGEFEPKAWISKYLFWPAPIKRTWSIQNMEPFKEKNIYTYRFCE